MTAAHGGTRPVRFANTPDRGIVFQSPPSDDGLARLPRDVTEPGGGLSLVTGEIGCRDVTLVRALADPPAATRRVIGVLRTPAPDAAEVAHAAGAPGVATPPGAGLARAGALGAHPAALRATARRRPVPRIDEARRIGKTMSEEVCLLTNHEDRTHERVHDLPLGPTGRRERVVPRGRVVGASLVEAVADDCR